MTDREREARIRERLRLRVESKPDTYALSHEDANTIIQALARAERYREALERVVYEWEHGRHWPGGFMYQIAHRALNDGEDDG